MSSGDQNGLTHPKILGVHLAGPPPLGEVFLDLSPGVIVLYGKNGAGKTSVISAIAETAGGVLANDRVAQENGEQYRYMARELAFEWLAPPDADAFDLPSDWFWLPGNPWLLRRTERGETEAMHRVRFRDTPAWFSDEQIEEIIETESEKSGLSALIKKMAREIALAAKPSLMAGEHILRWNTRAAADLAKGGQFLIRTDGTLLVRTATTSGPVFWLKLLLGHADRGWLQHLAQDEEQFRDLMRYVADNAHEVWATAEPEASDRSPGGDETTGEAPPSRFIDTDWYEHLMSSGWGTLLEHATEFLDHDQVAAPGWFGEPTVAIHPISRGAPVNVVLELQEDELEQRTVATLARRLTDPTAEAAGASDLLEERDGWYRLKPELAGMVVELIATARRWYGELLEGAPLLDLLVREPSEWPSSPPLEWRAIDETGAFVRLENLSSAQRRWASFALQIALLERSTLPFLIVLDEPEAALHRRAERHLAQGIQSLAEELGASVVVATHSPSFLNIPDARLVRVHRDSKGKTALESMDHQLRDRISQLGLNTEDLLQFCRTALLVEGEHELIIFDELFKHEFARRGIELFPLRGARSLKNASDAQLLFRYTQADVKVVLDNENAERVSDIWIRSCNAYDAGEDHHAVLRELVANGWTSEAKFLQEYCALAVKFSSRDRISFGALTLPDIVDYLPVSSIAPKATRHGDWTDLRRRYAQSGTRKDFKSWMSATYGAAYDEATIRAATRALNCVPDDFQALIASV